MMSVRQIWLHAVPLTLAIFCGPCTSTEISLTAEPLYVKKGENTLLTCSIQIEAFLVVFWNGIYYGPAECPGNRTIDDNTFASCVIKKTQYLHISNISKSTTWNCGVLQYYSNDVTVVIIVLPDRVVFKIDNELQVENRTMQKMENTSVTLRCEALARPTAQITLKINDVNMTTDNTTVSEIKSNNTFQTISEYVYAFKRLQTKYKVYCSAWVLDIPEVKSFEVDVDVTYPPDGPPVIISVENNTIYSVLEQSLVSFVCSIGPSNPAANPTWTTNDTTEGWKNKSINATTTELQGTATARNSVRCSCQSIFMDKKLANVVVNVNVFYQPNTVTANLTLNDGMSELLAHNFSVIIDTALSIVCFANGNPEPVNYSWSGSATNDSRYLNFMASKASTGQLTCSTFNVMELSNSTIITGKGNTTYIITVLYPPVVQDMANQSVIEGQDFFTTCKIEPGMVSTQSLQWMSESGEIFSSANLSFSKVNRTRSGIYTFKTNYTINPTYGKNISEEKYKSFYLNVLYPPEDILARLKLISGTEQNLTDTFSVVENETLTLVCSAEGNPKPSRYTWTGVKANNSKMLTFDASRDETGSLSCQAFNAMKPTVGINITGTGSRQYHVSVLYPPTLVQKHEERVIEGDDLERDCFIDPGKTQYLTVCWKKNDGLESGTQTCEKTLFIRNVTLEDEGFYNCTVNFTMIPTIGEDTSRSIHSGFYLYVMSYTAETSKISGGSNTLAVVSGVLSAAAVVAIVIVGLAYARKRKLLVFRSKYKAGQSGNGHTYENTGHTHGREMASTSETANIYVDLKSAAEVSDHEYQELSSMSGRKITGQQKIYENLQLSRHEKC